MRDTDTAMAANDNPTDRRRAPGEVESGQEVGAWRGGSVTLLSLAAVFMGLTVLASILTEYGRGLAGVIIMAAALIAAWLLGVLILARRTASDR